MGAVDVLRDVGDVPSFDVLPSLFGVPQLLELLPIQQIDIGTCGDAILFDA